jgi:hypothetical protein
MRTILARLRRGLSPRRVIAVLLHNARSVQARIASWWIEWNIRRVPRRGLPYRAGTSRDMHNYFAQVASNYHGFGNSFDQYVALVHGLRELESTRVLPLADLFGPQVEGSRNVGLRHDIDADPVTAVRCARFLARYALGGSFYLLHTAPYYGDVIHGVLVRNPQLVEWVRALIVAGGEIGLHNDALGLHKQHGIDGAAGLVTELDWLRSQGAVVRGTVAHNSAPVYGADNFEVFRGRSLNDRRWLRAEWGNVPLGRLSESVLGLTYEGTFANPRNALSAATVRAYCEQDPTTLSVRSAAWMRAYLVENPCLDWRTDLQLWLVGINHWVAGGRLHGRPLFEPRLDLANALRLLAEMPPGTRSVVVLHPEYVR